MGRETSSWLFKFVNVWGGNLKLWGEISPPKGPEKNTGYTSVIGTGSYPEFSTSTFGIPENSLSAVRCLPEEGTQAIALFEDGHYVGQMQVIYSSNSNLALTNFDNRVSSFIITGGTWEFFPTFCHGISSLMIKESD